MSLPDLPAGNIFGALTGGHFKTLRGAHTAMKLDKEPPAATPTMSLPSTSKPAAPRVPPSVARTGLQASTSVGVLRRRPKDVVLDSKLGGRQASRSQIASLLQSDRQARRSEATPSAAHKHMPLRRASLSPPPRSSWTGSVTPLTSVTPASTPPVSPRASPVPMGGAPDACMSRLMGGFVSADATAAALMAHINTFRSQAQWSKASAAGEPDGEHGGDTSPTASVSLHAAIKESISSANDTVLTAGELAVGMRLPDTKIAPRFFMHRVSPLGDASSDCVWDSVKRVWKTRVFPTNNPVSREEALLLAQVADVLLVEVKSLPDAAVPASEDAMPDIRVGFQEKVVREIDAWSVILHELVRQVFVHCEERGILLARAKERVLTLLAAADAWCRDHHAAREADARQARLVNAELRALKEYVAAQDSKMSDVLQSYAKREAAHKENVVATEAKYKDLRQLFFRQLEIMSGADNPDHDVLPSYDLLEALSEKGLTLETSKPLEMRSKSRPSRLWNLLVSNWSKLIQIAKEAQGGDGDDDDTGLGTFAVDVDPLTDTMNTIPFSLPPSPVGERCTASRGSTLAAEFGKLVVSSGMDSALFVSVGVQTGEEEEDGGEGKAGADGDGAVAVTEGAELEDGAAGGDGDDGPDGNASDAELPSPAASDGSPGSLSRRKRTGENGERRVVTIAPDGSDGSDDGAEGDDEGGARSGEEDCASGGEADVVGNLSPVDTSLPPSPTASPPREDGVVATAPSWLSTEDAASHSAGYQSAAQSALTPCVAVAVCEVAVDTSAYPLLASTADSDNESVASTSRRRGGSKRVMERGKGSQRPTGLPKSEPRFGAKSRRNVKAGSGVRAKVQSRVAAAPTEVAVAPSRQKIPAAWSKFMGLVNSERFWRGEAYKKGAGGRVVPRRQLQHLILQILQQKVEVDRDDLMESSNIQPLDEFVTNILLFKFGTKKLVMERLASLVKSVSHHRKDALIRMFGRFCGVLEPSLDSDALHFVLVGITKAFCGALPSINQSSKDTTIHVAFDAAMESLDFLGSTRADLDADTAKARLMLFTMRGTLPKLGEEGVVPKAAEEAAVLEAAKAATQPKQDHKAAAITGMSAVGKVSVCGPHHIRLPEFMEVLADLWTSASSMSADFLVTLFKESDENGDGVLQFDEFCILLDKMMARSFGHGKTLPPALMERLYVKALSMSDESEVDCELFVSVVQGFVTTEMQRFASSVDDDDPLSRSRGRRSSLMGAELAAYVGEFSAAPTKRRSSLISTDLSALAVNAADVSYDSDDTDSDRDSDSEADASKAEDGDGGAAGEAAAEAPVGGESPPG